MTDLQKKVLELVRAYYAEHGRGPTHRWLMAQLGLKSTSGTARTLKALVDYGFLKRVAHGTGNYVPAEAYRAALVTAPTADLLAELQRREAHGDRR